ncbi:hypothetical protein WR25_16512 [Diploscapter pachys]|uniref:AB hydrolase-1 domain-containing protein n=1 Tax=Diploscapter pachys TaxID=2018661 RepID=A0A2A2KJF9_9BILA|nr:hypothetical protein WR25_16512 [Diploscapter pachys]
MLRATALALACLITGAAIAAEPPTYGKQLEGFAYPFQQLADNTHALLASLGVNKAIVLGHSAGGMLATRYALMYPQQVERLAMVNPIGLEDWKALGVPYRTVDQWYARELKLDAEGVRNYERATYYAGRWKPEYERWVQMLVGLNKGPGHEAVQDPGTAGGRVDSEGGPGDLRRARTCPADRATRAVPQGADRLAGALKPQASGAANVVFCKYHQLVVKHPTRPREPRAAPRVGERRSTIAAIFCSDALPCPTSDSKCPNSRDSGPTGSCSDLIAAWKSSSFGSLPSAPKPNVTSFKTLAASIAPSVGISATGGQCRLRNPRRPVRLFVVACRWQRRLLRKPLDELCFDILDERDHCGGPNLIRIRELGESRGEESDRFEYLARGLSITLHQIFIVLGIRFDERKFLGELELVDACIYLQLRDEVPKRGDIREQATGAAHDIAALQLLAVIGHELFQRDLLQLGRYASGLRPRHLRQPIGHTLVQRTHHIRRRRRSLVGILRHTGAKAKKFSNGNE